MICQYCESAPAAFMLSVPSSEAYACLKCLPFVVGSAFLEWQTFRAELTAIDTQGPLA